MNVKPPVHAETGALSVGLTGPGTQTRILAMTVRHSAPARSARWSCADRRSCPDTGSAPDETGAAIVDGELRTGDVGVVDEDGWLYLVARAHDMIVASGFKVWPRESRTCSTSTRRFARPRSSRPGRLPRRDRLGVRDAAGGAARRAGRARRALPIATCGVHVPARGKVDELPKTTTGKIPAPQVAQARRLTNRKEEACARSTG